MSSTTAPVPLRASRTSYRIPDVGWGLGTALSFVAGTMLMIAVLQIVVPMLELPGDIADLIVWTVAYGLILVALAILTRTRGTGSWAEDFGLRFRPLDLLTGVASGVGTRLLAGLVTWVLVLLVGGASRGNTQAEAENGLFLVLNGFVAVVIVAPFVEELLFRGLVLRGIRHAVLRGGGAAPSAQRQRWAAVVAVGVSAVLFAAMHVYEGWGSPATMVALGGGTLVLGIVNGVWAVRTGRLWPGIITHMTFNLIAAVLAAMAAHGR